MREIPKENNDTGDCQILLLRCILRISVHSAAFSAPMSRPEIAFVISKF